MGLHFGRNALLVKHAACQPQNCTADGRAGGADRKLVRSNALLTIEFATYVRDVNHVLRPAHVVFLPVLHPTRAIDKKKLFPAFDDYDWVAKASGHAFGRTTVSFG
jgi:hypothetical protein